MIVLIRDDAPELLDRLRDIRNAGDVPLVGDARWPSAQRLAAARMAAGDAPTGTAWASLTSGSSGLPRIVTRSADSWAASFGTVAELLDTETGDLVALPAPPTSSLTLFSLAHALAGGPSPVFGPVVRSATATSMHGTPQALRAMLDSGVPPSMRSALIGGSHLDPALRKRAEAAGIQVTAYYGAAELSFVALDQGDGLRAFPGVQLDVRDGTLWVRSPYVASGYLGAPGPLRQENGWATVGDRVEFANGRLRVLGRADDAILSASATIVPEEVEAVLRTIPGVRDVMVFGLPRAPVGALVAALLELHGATPVGLRASVDAQLIPAHRPRQWFTGAIPRTTSGKPARAEAVRQVLAGEVRRLAI